MIPSTAIWADASVIAEVGESMRLDNKVVIQKSIHFEMSIMICISEGWELEKGADGVNDHG